MNCLLIFETSNVHIEVPQCLNIEDIGALDLDKLTVQQVFRARKWANELNLSCFRQSIQATVTNMRKEERFPAYLEVSWHMVAFTLRANSHAGKKDSSVHLVYEFGRTRNGAALVKSVTSGVGTSAFRGPGRPISSC
jgi:hypothetical protein